MVLGLLKPEGGSPARGCGGWGCGPGWRQHTLVNGYFPTEFESGHRGFRLKLVLEARTGESREL